jgi:hypothetical protein
MIYLDNYVKLRPNGNSARLYFWKGTKQIFSVDGNFYKFPYDLDGYIDLSDLSIQWRDKESGVFDYNDSMFKFSNGFDGFSIRAKAINYDIQMSMSFMFSEINQMDRFLKQAVIQNTIKEISDSIDVAISKHLGSTWG